jgi:hypothetical protein
MSLVVYTNDPCPKCFNSWALGVVDRHPTRRDIALHNFYCGNCGPVKTNFIALKPGESAAEAAANIEGNPKSNKRPKRKTAA